MLSLSGHILLVHRRCLCHGASGMLLIGHANRHAVGHTNRHAVGHANRNGCIILRGSNQNHVPKNNPWFVFAVVVLNS